MRSILLVAVVSSVLCGAFIKADTASAKVVCYYDGRSFTREGLGKVTLSDIEPALSFCSHLVYGFAGINAETKKVVSLNQNNDLDVGKGHYRLATSLKKKFPELKVLLGIGNGADVESSEKYLTLLESSASRISFVNSLYSLVKSYDFDGIDLAWQFPKIKPKRVRSKIGSAWHSFKKVFTGNSIIDEKSDEHKEEFTSLVRDIKNTFRHDHYILSLTVIPNINASLYYDVPSIISYVDYVNIAAFDQQTPERNPKEADFPAPIYNLNDRNPEFNVNYQVNYWIQNASPSSKINVGIPSFGRSWNMDGESGLTGVPPLKVQGSAPAGNQTNQEGFLSWPEVCALLPNPSNSKLRGKDAPLRRVNDPTKRFGPYAYRISDGDDYGMWVGYEDPDSSANKAAYVTAKNLGGIALFNLEYDDVHGVCSGDKFPILRAAKYRL